MTAAMLVSVFGMRMLTHHTLDFADRDNRQEATEQQEQCGKQSKPSNQHANIDPGRREIAPAGRQEVTT